MRKAIKRNFADRLIGAIMESRSYLCVGLDPQLRYIPPQILAYCLKKYGPGLTATAEAIIMFNQMIISGTAEYAMCYKPQMAFYECYGSEGVRAFESTVEYIDFVGKMVINDAKREDGGDTAEAYASGYLGEVDMIGAELFNPNGSLVSRDISPVNVDAITITPWIDSPNFNPFKEAVIKNGRGVFVVDKTSFKPASDLQEAMVVFEEEGTRQEEKAWVRLTRKIAIMTEGTYGEKGYSSLGAVMGATFPEEARLMKELLPKSFKLVPGYGAGQNGKADDAVICINPDGFGAVINNSRGTNYAWHPKFGGDGRHNAFVLSAAESAKSSRDELNAAVIRSIGSLPWE